MTWLIIILSILVAAAVFGLIYRTSLRLTFIEKEAEIIDLIPVYDSEYPETITGYNPVVRFEVDSKFYSGTPKRQSLRAKDDALKMVILYNPENPAEFHAKENSTVSAGCGVLIFSLLALAVALYYYLRQAA